MLINILSLFSIFRRCCPLVCVIIITPLFFCLGLWCCSFRSLSFLLCSFYCFFLLHSLLFLVFQLFSVSTFLSTLKGQQNSGLLVHEKGVYIKVSSDTELLWLKLWYLWCGIWTFFLDYFCVCLSSGCTYLRIAITDIYLLNINLSMDSVYPQPHIHLVMFSHYSFSNHTFLRHVSPPPNLMFSSLLFVSFL